jgi:hypothetical protein
MATTGPWLEPTPWPAVGWSLNVQLEYWLINRSNHLELGSLTSTLDLNRQQLVDNVPLQEGAGLGAVAGQFDGGRQEHAASAPAGRTGIRGGLRRRLSTMALRAGRRG